jgi:hypothetical protein
LKFSFAVFNLKPDFANQEFAVAIGGLYPDWSFKDTLRMNSQREAGCEKTEDNFFS